MSVAAKRKTSLSLDAPLARCRARPRSERLGHRGCGAQGVVAEARRRRWLEDNADAFRAQAEWHEKNGHPLAEIMVGPGTDTWKT